VSNWQTDVAWKHETVSVEETDLAIRIRQSETPIFLTDRTDLKHARRLLRIGIAVQGRLGKKYFGLSPSGIEFADNVLRNREEAALAS